MFSVANKKKGECHYSHATPLIPLLYHGIVVIPLCEHVGDTFCDECNKRGVQCNKLWGQRNKPWLVSIAFSLQHGEIMNGTCWGGELLSPGDGLGE